MCQMGFAGADFLWSDAIPVANPPISMQGNTSPVVAKHIFQRRLETTALPL